MITVASGQAHGPERPQSTPHSPPRSARSPLSFRDDIWFDDVDPADIEAAIGPEAASIARKQLGQGESSVTLVKERAFGGYAGPMGRAQPWGAGRVFRAGALASG